jgi:hypothetical protein
MHQARRLRPGRHGGNRLQRAERLIGDPAVNFPHVGRHPIKAGGEKRQGTASSGEIVARQRPPTCRHGEVHTGIRHPLSSPRTHPDGHDVPQMYASRPVAAPPRQERPPAPRTCTQVRSRTRQMRDSMTPTICVPEIYPMGQRKRLDATRKMVYICIHRGGTRTAFGRARERPAHR